MTRFLEIANDIENQYNSDFDWDSSKTSPPVRYIEYRLLELCETLDNRLTALEAAKPQAPAANCDEMLDTLLLSNADKRAAIANLTAEVKRLTAERDSLETAIRSMTTQRNAFSDANFNMTKERNALAAQLDDLRSVNAGLRIALSGIAPCTGTGSGGCDCLPDDED